MSHYSAVPHHTTDQAARATRRLIELVESYLQRLCAPGAGEPGAHVVTLIARSPASPAAGALAAKADELGARQVSARIIFAKPAPTEALEDQLSAMQPLLRGERITERVRWARNSGLLDAHEQMCLGAAICWSGDAMRRSPQRQGVLDMVEEGAPDAVRRASLAFSAMWAASHPLSSRHLRGEKRKVFDSLSEMALALHHREAGHVAIPSVGEDTTRH